MMECNKCGSVNTYIKINTLWKRDQKTGKIIDGDILGIFCTPDLGIMTVEEIINFVKSKPLSKISEDKTLPMEGIVARSHPLMLFRDGTPVMFKLKCRDYEGLK